jgi:hypothetical protein
MMLIRKNRTWGYILSAVSVLCFLIIVFFLTLSKSPDILDGKLLFLDYSTVSGVFDTLFTILNIVLLLLFGLCLYMGRGVLQGGTILLLVISYVLLNGINFSPF